MGGFLVFLMAGAALIATRTLFGRLTGLQAQLDRLETRLRALEPPAASTPAAAAPVTPESAPKTAPVAPPPVATDPFIPRALDAPARPRKSATALFEQYVGGKLPIWVGGAAIAIAGYYLVRIAIESGALTPAVRVALTLLAGLALLALSEATARIPRLRDDPRVGQALCGAAIAILYATAYLASAIYGLITSLTSFLLMAAVTAAALGLSLRRGLPVALMGLIGGFATPILAGGDSDSAWPVLVYLALLSGGLFAVAIGQGWFWLTLATAAGSLLWGGVLIATLGDAQPIAIGGFILILAFAATAAAPAVEKVRHAALIRLAPVAVGLIELALLIPRAGFGLEAWGLYLLASGGVIALALRDTRLAPLVTAAFVLSLIALGPTLREPATGIALFGAIGTAVLFGGGGHAFARRPEGGVWWAATGAAAIVLPLLMIREIRWALLPEWGWGLLALAAAMPSLHLAWRARGGAAAKRPFDPVLLIAAGAAALLGCCGAIDLPPDRWIPVALMLVALATTESARRISDAGVACIAMAAAALGFGWMLHEAIDLPATLLFSLGGQHVLLPDLPKPVLGLTALLLPAAVAAAAAGRMPAFAPWLRAILAALAGVAFAGFAYILLKQPFAIRVEDDFVARGFLERAILTQLCFGAAFLAERLGRRRIALPLLGLAIFRVVWFDLLLLDPAWVTQYVMPWPILNLVTLHFGLAGAWVTLARRAAASAPERLAFFAALLALLGGGVALATRQAFHGAILADGHMGTGEFYAYSVAGVLLAIGLLLWGVRGGDRWLRLAGLAVLTAMVLKVFLIDAAALAGLLRVASFLGLGVALIGIGWAYGRFLAPQPAETPMET